MQFVAVFPHSQSFIVGSIPSLGFFNQNQICHFILNLLMIYGDETKYIDTFIRISQQVGIGRLSKLGSSLLHLMSWTKQEETKALEHAMLHAGYEQTDLL